MTVRWAPLIEFVSSSIPSGLILTAHAQPFKGARDLTFCLKVPLDSMLVWASSEGSGETARMRRLAWTFAARMRRLAWTFAARIGDKYQIRLTRPKIMMTLDLEFGPMFCRRGELSLGNVYVSMLVGTKQLYTQKVLKTFRFKKIM